jgi:hypothetical protein
MSALAEFLRAIFPKPLPWIDVQCRAMYHLPPTSPAPSLYSTIHNMNGEKVAVAAFAVSPINDRVYVFDIKTEKDFIRQGYASAFIWHLHETYRLPITPVHVLWTADDFWTKMRFRGKFRGMTITREVGSDFTDEKNRWCHLEPEADKLREAITHRLFALHEPYEVATSRGLADDESH